MRRAVLFVLIAVACLLASPGPASAECTALDPWPTFRGVVRAADRVIVARVIRTTSSDPTEYTKVMDLKILEVLRGPGRAGDVEHLEFLRSGLPLKICPDMHFRARRGQVIAFALGARTPDGTLINSVAWIRGHPDAMQRNLGTITRAELRALVALPQTDAGAAAGPVSGGAPWPGPAPSTALLLAAAGFVAGLAAYRRVGRRSTRA